MRWLRGRLPSLLSILAATVASAQEGRIDLYYGAVRPAARSEAPASPPARPFFDPATGCYLGAYIELDPLLKKVVVDSSDNRRKLPEEFEEIVGKSHAIYFFYLGYGRPLPMDWVRSLASRGKMVHIALEPNDGLVAVKDDTYLRKLADDMAASGAKIFLRFASEMNGTWTNYSGDPELYKEKWRLLTRVIRERADNVAMVWCPYTTPRDPIPNYYPGDEWVDWVGVNMYNVTYFNQDRSTPAHHVGPTDMLDYIYRRYADRKPIMIGEYASTHFSALENKPVVDFAVENIRELYQALRTRYPRVKAINYSNSNNLLLSHRQNNNYTVTANPRVLASYRAAITSAHFIGGTASGNLAALPERTTDDLAKNLGLKPLADGSFIEGRVTVAAWVAARSSKPIVRALVNGKVVAIAHRGDFWEIELDAGTLGSGDHRLLFEAYDSKGKMVAKSTAIVTVK